MNKHCITPVQWNQIFWCLQENLGGCRYSLVSWRLSNQERNRSYMKKRTRKWETSLHSWLHKSLLWGKRCHKQSPEMNAKSGNSAWTLMTGKGNFWWEALHDGQTDRKPTTNGQRLWADNSQRSKSKAYIYSTYPQLPNTQSNAKWNNKGTSLHARQSGSIYGTL